MAKKHVAPNLHLAASLPPSINTQYSTVKGRRVLSEEARKWKREVKRKIELLEDEGILTDQLKKNLARSYLSIFLDFYFTTPLKRDLDGGLKITLDAVCEALDLND